MKDIDASLLGFGVWAVNAIIIYAVISFSEGLSAINILGAMGASLIFFFLLIPVGIPSLEAVILGAIINAFRKRRENDAPTIAS
jgi:hypothetical protein